MDLNEKKTVLRMIPYGLYVLTAANKDQVAAGTVNWVTQASFQPPLVVVGVKADSFLHTIVQESGKFVLNVLGKEQQSLAFTFFKPAKREGNTISGEPFHAGVTGSPILDNCIGFAECTVVETVQKGDHTIVIGEVVNAGLNTELKGRADHATLLLGDLGENIFYGG